LRYRILVLRSLNLAMFMDVSLEKQADNLIKVIKTCC
jgi:hypothetical protein